MSKLHFGLTLGLLIASVALSAPALYAQTAGSGSAVSGSATIAPGYTVLPVPNYDRADDEIVQLNNLTIQNIIGNTVYASANSSPCSVFDSASGYGRSIPCPLLAPNILYQISVQSDTILLLRNRARTNLSTFAAGDHINVFGFLDRSSQYMQALIMRDLDKPVVGEQYVQFNNLEVLSNPNSPVPPASFTVAAAQTPCWLYSGAAGYRVSADAICPQPLSPTVTPDGNFARPFYSVQVTSETRILNLYRVRSPLSIINAGDRVNIFGRFIPGTNTIEALIVRDLSSDGSTNTGTVQITVVDNQIRCITTPCGYLPGIKVQLGQSTAITNNSGIATFSNVPAGNYTATAYASDGRSASTLVVLTNTGFANATIFLPDNTSSGSLRVISPNGGEVLTRNTNYTLQWAIPPIPAGQYSAGNSFDIYAVRRNINGDMVSNIQETIAKGIYADFGMTTGTYNWLVGQLRYECSSGYCATVMPYLPDGSYYLKVCYAGTTTCDESDGTFAVLSPPTTLPVFISSIYPAAGYVGTQITLTGTSFASTNNVVRLDGGNGNVAYLPYNSSNGSSITFTMPSYTSYSCQYNTSGGPICLVAAKQLDPGNYNVWVENANGTSNQTTFTLYR